MTVHAAPSPIDGFGFGNFDTGAIVAKAGSENFPVALRVLPVAIRVHLVAIYAYARLIDDLGDRYIGDRLEVLDRAQAELDRAWAGEPAHPVFADVVKTAQSAGTGRAPLDDLISANRLDQRKARYASYEELEAYCALSANPVGRLVLGVFGATDPRSVELSDRICTGLQLVEHLQDIGEDARDGRVYFPKPDLDRFGVGISDLLGTDSSPGLRRLVSFESARARALLTEGLPLVSRLEGVRRLALAGFVGGGIAQLDEIAKRQFDVLGQLAKASKRSVSHVLGTLGVPSASGVTVTTLEAAYARCEEITKAEAKNFSYGIRLLPDEKRRAMSALYAFARRVDDVGDGATGIGEKLDALQAIRADLDSLDEGHAPEDDAVLVGLLDAIRRYGMSTDAMRELVTGCEMDCSTSRYETWDALAVYCRCVAGSIGRLSLSVFGCGQPERGERLADTLGLALQLTNILRDIVEDRDVMGRVYLPAGDLERFGVSVDASGPPEALSELIRFECGRARRLYGEGLELLDLLDRRSRACVAAMSGIYRHLLDRIEDDPLAVLDHRVSVPAWQKASVAVRSLARVRS